MRLISQHTMISILVQDQDKALQFYTEKLGLEKRQDLSFGPELRLVTVALQGQLKPEIALAKPDVAFYGEERVKELTTQIRQKVSSIFVTQDCQRTYVDLQARGVPFVCTPTQRRYGLEAIFTDLDGNTFVLLEAAPEALSLMRALCIDSAA
jgi:catechol 2,3-dioxygenase-like lactoylglutathione lyase family enzyme